MGFKERGKYKRTVRTRKRLSESLKGHITTESTRRKISEALKGRKLTDEHKQKVSESLKGENSPWYGKKRSEEAKRKMSEAKRGENNPMYGKKCSDETRQKISEALKGRQSPMTGKKHTEETKQRISEARKGCYGLKNNHWKGGISFEPYCRLFNFELKENIRNRDERRCQLCGKSELLEGRRLSVHHIDGDKMQGCDDKRWYLVALCHSCNVKSDTALKEFLIISNKERV